MKQLLQDLTRAINDQTLTIAKRKLAFNYLKRQQKIDNYVLGFQFLTGAKLNKSKELLAKAEQLQMNQQDKVELIIRKYSQLELFDSVDSPKSDSECISDTYHPDLDSKSKTETCINVSVIEPEYELVDNEFSESSVMALCNQSPAARLILENLMVDNCRTEQGSISHMAANTILRCVYTMILNMDEQQRMEYHNDRINEEVQKILSECQHVYDNPTSSGNFNTCVIRARLNLASPAALKRIGDDILIKIIGGVFKLEKYLSLNNKFGIDLVEQLKCESDLDDESAQTKIAQLIGFMVGKPTTLIEGKWEFDTDRMSENS